jgi:Putative Ig domain
MRLVDPRFERSLVKILLAAAAALCLVALAPSASATPPDVAGNPSLWLVASPQNLQIPPAQPKVGDTIEGTWAYFICDPSCDPNSPDADPNVGKRIISPSDSGPPAGFKMSWERCPDATGTNCTIVRDRMQKGTPGAERYTVTAADAGSYIRAAVYGTNLDCSEVVRDPPLTGTQYCKWETRGVYSALVEIARTIVISPASLPDGQAGVRYEVPITAANGAGGYAYALTGSLPPGMSFTGGAVQGTPTTAGVYTFTVMASGAGAAPGSRTYTLRIRLGWPSTQFPAGTTGVAYNQPLSVIGANGPVTWTVDAGTLPAGISIVNGALAGTPTQKGSFGFTLRATDAAGSTATNAYTIDVAWPTLTTSQSVLAKATRGLRYRATLQIGGGTEPYTVALIAGRLPVGLSLSPKGVVSGIPREKTSKRSFRFVVMVTDRYGAQTPILFSVPYAGKAKTAKKAA